MRHDLKLCFASPNEAARTVYILPPGHDHRAAGAFDVGLDEAGKAAQRCAFLRLTPGEHGVTHASFNCPSDDLMKPEIFGVLASDLPQGAWRIDVSAFPEARRVDAAQAVFLGFCMGAYTASLRRASTPQPRIVVDEAMRGAQSLAEAFWLGRDLINLPANMLGPAELAQHTCEALIPLGVRVDVITGQEVATQYPCLAAVGAGSARLPCVVVASWAHRQADAHTPLLSLVGKGVCFDTGGLDIKPSTGMRKMKKDMGGAALLLALTKVLVQNDVPIRLELRLGCVENSISGSAMRPGDVLQTRSGLLVEVDNTDAEGRLVMSDLLTEACEAEPDYLLDAATLTGAARIALGADLVALFSNDDNFASILTEAGNITHEPLWRLPLWQDYNALLTSEIADLANASSTPMAGAITAALFLERFVKPSVKWAHIDTYAWNDVAKPGRPSGGEIRCLRALYHAITTLSNRALAG